MLEHNHDKAETCDTCGTLIAQTEDEWKAGFLNSMQHNIELAKEKLELYRSMNAVDIKLDVGRMVDTIRKLAT